MWNSLARGPVGQLLYRYACLRLANADQALDVLQGCLMELSMGRTYEPTGGDPKGFRTWVYACLRYHIYRLYRSRMKEHEYAGAPISAVEVATESAWTDRWRDARRIETNLVANSMLGTLPPRKREILTRSLRGETDVEIARALGLKPGNVRQILSRANRDLRKKFGISTPATP